MVPSHSVHKARPQDQPSAVPAPTRRFWLRLVQNLLPRAPTPFFLFSVEPVQQALQTLYQNLPGLPVRSWLSAKTQPLPALWQWWKQQGRPIEVVSEFELRAALAEGFPPGHILLNGPAKHHWLPQFHLSHFWVNLDSAAEAAALLPLARQRNWRLGLRLHLGEEHDPENPAYPTQFGLEPRAAAAVLKDLRRHGLEPEVLHFHLRTQVHSAACYERALREASQFCHQNRWQPRFVDCGGGWPAPSVRDRNGQLVAAHFSLPAIGRLLHRARAWFPGLQEYWLENGRWLTGSSGVLVVRVLDLKQRRGMRHLICNGGRTLHALVATWEQHPLLTLPTRRGRRILTTVTGPTCMAFDQLARCLLPASLRTGDHLLWLDAGAYHLPWETRFSHGTAGVYWHDGTQIRRVRAPESFESWWGRWLPSR